jgi:hypothetical protein
MTLAYPLLKQNGSGILRIWYHEFRNQKVYQIFGIRPACWWTVRRADLMSMQCRSSELTVLCSWSDPRASAARDMSCRVNDLCDSFAPFSRAEETVSFEESGMV